MTKSTRNVNLPTGMKTSLAIPAGVQIARLASLRVIRVEISSGKPNFFQTKSGIKLMIAPRSARALHLSSLNLHGMRNFPGSPSFSDTTFLAASCGYKIYYCDSTKVSEALVVLIAIGHAKPIEQDEYFYTWPFIKSVDFCPTDRHLLCSCDSHGEVHIWNVESRLILCKFKVTDNKKGQNRTKPSTKRKAWKSQKSKVKPNKIEAKKIKKSKENKVEGLNLPFLQVIIKGGGNDKG
nr:hypothetical protein [Tanacetum cinerariifolium]